jgi:hypothetical protein
MSGAGIPCDLAAECGVNAKTVTELIARANCMVASVRAAMSSADQRAVVGRYEDTLKWTLHGSADPWRLTPALGLRKERARGAESWM